MPLNCIGSFNVFISHDRLPWSTLEIYLEKRGIGLINWPAEVPRKHSNRGINDLSAEHADALYHAIKRPDKENRLGLRYLPTPAGMSCLPCHYHLNAICTAFGVTDTTHDVNVASSFKCRPHGEQESRPQKRARNAFKITTPNDFSNT